MVQTHRTPTSATFHGALACVGLTLALLLQACAATPTLPDCPSGRIATVDGCAPAGAVEDAEIEELLRKRSWLSQKEQRSEGFDPVTRGIEFELPINEAFAKIVGVSDEDARNSLAAKLWMIENAKHTIDFGYYIFRNDLVGRAMLGALCEAVQRGVDVRVLLDSAGSMSTNKTPLLALGTCAERAGWVRNADGTPTTRKARVQMVLFNALTSVKGNINRRSHDKLLVMDGAFGDQALMMTGGRNISLDYYGIDAEGQPNPNTYRDAEILLRPSPEDPDLTIGQISEGYFSLLFLFKGNRWLTPIDNPTARRIYDNERRRSEEALKQLRALPLLAPHIEAMDEWMAQDFRSARTLLAFNLANLDNPKPVSEVASNWERNPNSILYVLNQISDQAQGDEVSRIVSPYLFLARYEDKDGKLILDEAEKILRWLDEHPEARVEIITNSVLTSDNFFTQAIIDFDLAPRLLLTPEQREAWSALTFEEERTAELTRSDAWRERVDHSRLQIYETGKLDAAAFAEGGRPYGKLHAKFWTEGEFGFVGTTNFDYRSRLFNSEMGYFFRSPQLVSDLDEEFEKLKNASYRWGSPEWLEMRARTGALSGSKGSMTRKQRNIYRTLKSTGLYWLF